MKVPRLTQDQILAGLKDLPPLPAVVQELMASLGEDTLSAEAIASKLSRDPGLSAKTLRMANSSFYGRSRQVGSVQEALTILGLRTVRTLVLAAGVRGNFAAPSHVGFDIDHFWRHAIGAALCAQALALETRMDGDIAFTVGLLHDIGRISLVCTFPDDYAQVISHQRAHDSAPIDAERAVLGVDHATVGGMLAEKWQFSPLIVEAIACHHAPAMHHGPGLVGLVHMADAFSHALGLSGEADEVVPSTPPDIWQAMAPDADTCLRMFAQIEAQFEGVCQALQV